MTVTGLSKYAVVVKKKKVLEMLPLSALDPGSALSQQQEHSESRHEPTVPNAPVASKMLGHSLFE